MDVLVIIWNITGIRFEDNKIKLFSPGNLKDGLLFDSKLLKSR